MVGVERDIQSQHHLCLGQRLGLRAGHGRGLFAGLIQRRLAAHDAQRTGLDIFLDRHMNAWVHRAQQRDVAFDLDQRPGFPAHRIGHQNFDRLSARPHQLVPRLVYSGA